MVSVLTVCVAGAGAIVVLSAAASFGCTLCLKHYRDLNQTGTMSIGALASRSPQKMVKTPVHPQSLERHMSAPHLSLPSGYDAEMALTPLPSSYPDLIDVSVLSAASSDKGPSSVHISGSQGHPVVTTMTNSTLTWETIEEENKQLEMRSLGTDLTDDSQPSSQMTLKGRKDEPLYEAAPKRLNKPKFRRSVSVPNALDQCVDKPLMHFTVAFNNTQSTLSISTMSIQNIPPRSDKMYSYVKACLIPSGQIHQTGLVDITQYTLRSTYVDTIIFEDLDYRELDKSTLLFTLYATNGTGKKDVFLAETYIIIGELNFSQESCVINRPMRTTRRRKRVSTTVA